MVTSQYLGTPGGKMGTASETDEGAAELIINEHYRVISVPGVGQLLVSSHDKTLPGSILFERQEIDELMPMVRGTVLDIGANVGAHAICFARKAQTVYAFEPQPHTFRLLEANLAINLARNVIAMPFALGTYDSDGLILPIDPLKEHSSQGACLADHGEAIKIRRLDGFQFAGLDF